MAVFSSDPTERERLDFQLLQNSPVTLYFRAGLLDEDLDWLVRHGYRVDRLDCAGWTASDVVHATLRDALRLPGYQGHSLDAFADSLEGLDVPDDGGRVLVFTRYDVPAAAIPDVARDLLDIIAAESRQHLLHGRRLLALVQTDDPELAFEPVGACVVEWNPKECTNAARGL